jgi:asparagine synthase (glutamine-hydrolysing)
LSAPLHTFGRHGARAARMLDAMGQGEDALRMALLLTVESRLDPPESLLLDDARARFGDCDPFLAYRNSARRFAGEEPVQKMLLTDLCVQLPSQFLPKVDRATMALGLEARVPLLDDRVLELALRLPSGLKVRGAQKKIVLRDACRDRLPAGLVDAPKMGFGVPYEHWLRQPLHTRARECVLSAKFLQRFGFDGAKLSRLFDEHRAGTREHGFMLWKLFQLALWSEKAS